MCIRDSILPPDIVANPGPIHGTMRQAGAPPNVVVSGWQVYDNKGRVVEKFEPFFDSGWDYGPPVDSKLGRKAEIFYDPRGRVNCTLRPDRSEHRVIHGIPLQLDDPPLSPSDVAKFRPSPWEAYSYD